jgi:hypothetical protein
MDKELCVCACMCVHEAHKYMLLVVPITACGSNAWYDLRFQVKYKMPKIIYGNDTIYYSIFFRRVKKAFHFLFN